ncbi:MAG TPA: hypothetical protein VD860_11465 [Azospirillum sp.]|nr:hypothetical protein [Azospirillum sp.]
MTPKERSAILFLVKHLAAGVTAGLVFCAAMLGFDVGSLRTLLVAADSVGVGLYLFVGSICITFGSVAMGVGIMGLGDHRDHPDREY